ncbi:hypothetical protein [Kaistella palustris]|uniref:hypothetical protein n=1 Tax=Kaistella palustris TaxID=493376 RepID=UPI00041A514C|nr:hypothetical protein [Kaistella palustris]
MKDLDIEKLERKNIYDCPADFFEQMQSNVLRQTSTPQKGRIINLNWAYAAAAAITLLFGVTFFVTQGTSEAPIDQTNAVASNAVTTPVTNTLSAVESQEEEVVPAEKPENNLTFQHPANPTGEQSKAVAVKTGSPARTVQKKEASAKNVEIQMDQVLANFPSAELADLGRNAEQDVYLDLYN